MIRIESTSNSIFKQTKKLLSPSNRRKTGMFLIEGERIVKDAISLGAQMEYILISDTYQKSTDCNFDGQRVYILSDKLFDELKSTVNTQGILAVSKYTDTSPEDIDYSKGLYLYLDSVTDPGNMGTIIRTAEGAGVDAVFMSKDCVDIYNPKTIRSTMGSIYRMPFIYIEEIVFLLDEFRKKGIKSYAAHLDGENSYDKEDYRKGTAILIGNEGNGLTDETAGLADTYIRIPMEGKLESLNAAVAAAILMYEVHRQRG